MGKRPAAFDRRILQTSDPPRDSSFSPGSRRIRKILEQFTRKRSTGRSVLLKISVTKVPPSLPPVLVPPVSGLCHDFAIRRAIEASESLSQHMHGIARILAQLQGSTKLLLHGIAGRIA